jgi:PAS domain S-box-containing protein
MNDKKKTESLSRAQTYLDLAGVMFVALDVDGKVTLINRKGCEVMGFRENEIVGKNWFDNFIPDRMSAEIKVIFGRLMAGEIDPAESYENPVLTKSGSERLIAWHNTILRDDDGKIIGTLSSGEDITARKRAEDELLNALLEIRRLNERIEAENVYLREEIRMAHLHGDIVGQSEAMKSVMAQAEQVAKTDSTVLILGETGTGKELLARAIHNMSSRKDRPLIVVNCAAMPAALIESELFGREKGAYTGAITRQIGRFEVANESTVFLDEIAELSPELQAKLLRFLQEGQFERLGSNDTITVNVRVIAATNRDLEKEVSEGRFREDLYYRLNVFPIGIPPLRERTEDIHPLVWAFVNEFGDRMGKRIDSVSRQSMEALERYPWPGNIRELRNVIERAMIRSEAKTLHVRSPSRAADAIPSGKTLAEVDRDHIIDVLKRTGWKVRGKGGAAEILGLKPTTLEARMKKLKIKRPK